MAIVRGQWYQWKAFPDRFYRVSLVTSTYVQLYPYDTTKYQVTYVSPTYLQNNFRLLDWIPRNMLLDGATSSHFSTTRSYVLDDELATGHASGKSGVSKAHGLIDTRLSGRVHQLLMITKSKIYLSVIQVHANILSRTNVAGKLVVPHILAGHVVARSAITGRDYSVYPLGGHLASQGRVVQAHAN